MGKGKGQERGGKAGRGRGSLAGRRGIITRVSTLGSLSMPRQLGGYNVRCARHRKQSANELVCSAVSLCSASSVSFLLFKGHVIIEPTLVDSLMKALLK